MSRRRFSSYMVIENWSNEDVQQFLEKNGFQECCSAFKSRNVDGHAFLTLTEGHLMLWKRELSMVNIRKLSKLIQELAQEPEKYVFPVSENNGATTPPIKTDKFSTFRPHPAGQGGLQKSSGTTGGPKEAGGVVASIVSSLTHVDRRSAAVGPSDAAPLAMNRALHADEPPRPLPLQARDPDETSSSCSDNCSWDTNFSDDDEAPPYLIVDGTEVQNNGDVPSTNGKRVDPIQPPWNFQLPQKPSVARSPAPDASPGGDGPDVADGGTSRARSQALQKPQVASRLPELSPGRVATPGEPPPVPPSTVKPPRKLPAPPLQELQNPLHVEKIVNTLNKPTAVEKAFTEKWDEEEQYESIDNENLPSREAITALLDHGKLKSPYSSAARLSPVSPQEAPGQLNSSWTSEPPRNLQNGWSRSLEQPAERSASATATPQPPAVPVTKRLPPAVPMGSRPLPPQPGQPHLSTSGIPRLEHADAMLNDEEQYESVDEAHAAQHARDRNMSDEYELIADGTKELTAERGGPGEAIDYYLEPVAKGSGEGSRPSLLPKPAGSLGLPLLEPPIPPGRSSEDMGSSSSSPGNSADGVTGLFGGFIRKLKPNSASSSIEKEKTPTPEAKKPQPLPPPDHRPPPLVDRLLANQRPLPPTPEAGKAATASPKEQSNAVSRGGSQPTSFTQMPWYHSVDRDGAEELLRNSQDGTFLLRPSTRTKNPLSLTLWYKNRLYNISVRHRPDGKYSLGYEKPNEQCFTSVEELVTNYQSENLVLYTNGEKTGRTLLTGWPQRRD